MGDKNIESCSKNYHSSCNLNFGNFTLEKSYSLIQLNVKKNESPKAWLILNTLTIQAVPSP